jgi:glycosyltransferase involved in cell wall biosynthesis
MKLAHVLTRGDVLGGAQSHVRELAQALLDLGHDVTVITGAAGVFTGQLQRAGIPSIQLRSLVRPVRPHKDLAALLELWSVLGQLKPDLVCAHTAKAGSLARAAARMHHIPSVFTPHGWSMFDRASLQPNPLYWCAERLAGRLGTRVINVCEYERGLAERFAVCPSRALDVVPNGIAAVSLPRTRAIEAQPPVLVMVARFAAQKDHRTLLHALAGLLGLPWRLLLVGDGELKARVTAETLALGLKNRVEFLPGDCDVDRLLLEAQIFVLSTNFEALPISILEAMRAGLPVVATNVGGVGEAVRDGETGLLAGHRDVEELRLGLARLITQPGLRVRLGAAGYRLWEREFTASAMAARTLEVYERAIKEERMGLRPVVFNPIKQNSAKARCGEAMGHPSRR